MATTSERLDEILNQLETPTNLDEIKIARLELIALIDETCEKSYETGFTDAWEEIEDELDGEYSCVDYYDEDDEDYDEDDEDDDEDEDYDLCDGCDEYEEDCICDCDDDEY